MISIIITAYKEERTIGKAIESFQNQKTKEKYEILVVCPDKETKAAIKKYKVKHVQDPGKGKPIALNKAFKVAKGDILILTDGDVYVGNNSIDELVKPFKDKKMGAVTSRPISTSSRKTMLGYWSHLLTDAGAHSTRLQRSKQGKFIVCSGYLFAMRKLFTKIPEDALSDDAVMSHMVRKKGYKIGYAPKAKVFVKYPTTFKDWVLQKKRSTGGYNQIPKYFGKVPRMRSFWREAVFGTFKALSYPRNPIELFYTLMLFIARIWLWILIFYDINIKKSSFSKVWQRVETTK